ncbi:methyl-accepting chemotaxis protein [Oceanobacillus profundus]|uniref:Methyl-accepting chemotaxis protein n=1 Tax=Oceanobacillus profundus TaxID=372463 RepID=A0A417YA97_9BACI|nr:methyl-accepting chemotaxis protein [Oceanobacillus profundus]MBR3120513.1 methyl-accepting chemotaxis protein [Oceanobacillus sp.]MDO6448789.1 methyl-accepting chemotaxis protein [Oceanobacillus profundus]PAE27399.1 methyl-accepting chemotaxis protein [Paenibacillus sp. 7884-2]RHW29481.1 methyl-accepting chemotaxis protein [Oceanobacillus profundus]
MKRFYHLLLTKTNLHARLSILFLSLIFLSVTAVGVTSYIQAKQMTITTIEDRLVREAQLIGYIAENLHFLYVSDEDYFMQQLNSNIRTQQSQLETDGMESDFFYIADNSVTPFPVSADSLPNIPDSLVQTITESQDGQLQRVIDGETYTITFQQMDEINGTYVLLVPTQSFMAPVNSMGFVSILITATSIILSTILIILFVRTLTKPLSVLRDTMREVRNGNLQNSVAMKTTIPEFVSLHRSYDSMINQMTTMFNELKKTAVELSRTGKTLEHSSDDALQYSHDLTESINVVKLGAEQTANSSESSVASFITMKNKTEDIITNMAIVFSNSKRMGNTAITGEKHISRLINTTQAFENDFEHLTKTIQQVNEYSMSISNSVGLIQGIAEQTKLLALNATIEAARAGESGKGFSVVANEVGKLAEQSSATAAKITQSISNMGNITSNATEEFEQMLNKIGLNITTANDAKLSLDNLMKEIAKVGTKLQDMNAELESLKNEIPALEYAADEFASVSQETLASAEEMRVKSEQQYEQMQRTHEVGLTISGLSKSLERVTTQFEIESSNP